MSDSLLDKQWKTLRRQPVNDVREEVAKLFADGERDIHIGTDAQKHGRHTEFVTAVVVLNPGKGGAAFYTKTRMEYINSLQYKLFTEVSLSLEIALALCEAGIPAEMIDVHVDANTNLNWGSGPFHQRLAGMVVSHGFKAVLKPDAWCASHVADHAVNHKNLPFKLKRRRRKSARKAGKRKGRK